MVKAAALAAAAKYGPVLAAKCVNGLARVAAKHGAPAMNNVDGAKIATVAETLVRAAMKGRAAATDGATAATKFKAPAAGS
jgi:hypothetical protein